MRSERSEQIRKLMEEASTPAQRVELAVLFEISLLLNEDGKLIAEVVSAQNELRKAFENYVAKQDKASSRFEGTWRFALVIFPIIAATLGWFVLRYVINQNDAQDTAIRILTDKVLTIEVQQTFNASRLNVLEQHKGDRP